MSLIVEIVTAKRLLAVVGLATLMSTASCEREPFEEPMELGGQTVQPEVLNKGYSVYRKNCIACHGKTGDGDGASAHTMTPAPRDLTLGLYKFKSTTGEALPLDGDLERTVTKGLKGTKMNGFDLSQDELEAVIQYIKTFSDRWADESPGTPVEIPSDPWVGERQKAIARGREVYHGLAQCWTCHPAYEDRDTIAVLAGGFPEAKAPEWRSDLSLPAEVNTEYGKLLPPDFFSATFRAAWTGADLYRTIAAGIGGTDMPSWSKHLKNDDLWAVVYYVRELNRLGKLRRNIEY